MSTFRPGKRSAPTHPSTRWRPSVTISPSCAPRGLVEKAPYSRRYRLVGKGYSICLIFLKLFERIYAPLTAGILKPFSRDRRLTEEKRCALDRLYQRIVDDLNELIRTVGLKVAA